MALSVDDIEDIKQLLVANNGVIFAEMEQMIEEKLNEKFDEKLAPIHQKIDGLIDFVTEAIDTSNGETGKQLTNHEQRITKLEQAAA